MENGARRRAARGGCVCRRNPEDEEFGEERLQQLLRQAAHLPADEISARLSDAMTDWVRDAEQYDDLTFIVMKVR